MQQEYIDQLVIFFQESPPTPQTLSDIKEKALLWGATPEEFDEALHQSGLQDNSKQNRKEPESSDEKKLLKKLVEFDLALHGVVIVLLGFLAIFLFQTFNRPQTTISSQQAATLTPRSLVPPVYANTVEIDAEEVFSYPAKSLTLAISGTPKKDIYGYFPYWMLENQETVSLDTLTTLSFFGLTVDGSGSIITRYSNGSLEKGWQSWSSPQLQELITRAKKKNIHIELTLKSFNNEDIEQLVLSDDSQKTFINNAIQLVQSKALDGINLDFEYAGTPEKKVSEGFSRLITNLKSEMTKQIPNATLSLSTYINEAALPRLVPIENVEQHVDSFIIMGYDFHTPSGASGAVAPLNGQVSLIGYMQSYLEKVEPSKLILALPHYGYDWKEGGEKEEHRILPYVIANEESKKYGVQWDEITQTPWYSYVDPESGEKRITHFENIRSLGLKYDYINSKDLKGVGIWAMGYEGNTSEINLLLQEKFMR